MANDGIPKGNPYWALVLGTSLAVAALLYGLWLVSPHQLRNFLRSSSAPAAEALPNNMPPPPPPPPLQVYP